MFDMIASGMPLQSWQLWPHPFFSARTNVNPPVINARDWSAKDCVHRSAVSDAPPPITERPHAPSGVAAFMSAHSKTPYITPSMEFSSGKGVVRGRRGQQLTFTLCTAGIKNGQLIDTPAPHFSTQLSTVSLSNISNISRYMYGRTHM